MQDKAEEFWYNSQTRQVEVGKQTLAIYRLGPFATRAEAEKAPQIVSERAAKWRDEDETREN